MNNRRRKRIKEAINMLEKGFELKDYDTIDYSRDIIEYVLDEEEYSYDNIPESLQYSERAERSYDAIEILRDSYDMLDWITETEFENDKDAQVKEAIEEAIIELRKILWINIKE